MYDKVNHLYQQLRKRHHALVVAFVLVLVGSLLFWPNQPENLDNEPVKEQPRAVISGPIMNASEPVRLVIPKLNINVVFTEPTGLNDAGELDLAQNYEDVSYYRYGPTPGELGPAVVLGHVDSVDGPAVFYALGQLEVGDRMLIERADGSTAVFLVTELERPSQNAFPTEKVYGNIDHAGLRLVTCSGVYDKGEQRYSHNLVVYGTLVIE